MGKEPSWRPPSMNRVFVLAEGQTEEIFVREVLAPHLALKGVSATAIIITTKRVKDGPNFRGGAVNWDRVIGDIARCCKDSNVVAITTMIDYYGLGAGFDERATSHRSEPEHRVSELGDALIEKVNDPRFRPFFMLHEFEALLYSDPSVCADYLECPGLFEMMTEAVKACGSPESVNDSPETAPSKRIDASLQLASKNGYSKTVAPLIVEAIGLDKVRLHCPHFDAWVTWLESLGS
jgi:hypothetical protein